MRDEESEKEWLLIGELAEMAAVSRDTLRHYERKGVLPRSNRTSKGYRLYPIKILENIRMVRRALAVGFTLDEIARTFAERDGGRAPCREVRSLAASNLEIVRARLAELDALRDELENLVAGWDLKLERISRNEPARLLEDLAAPPNDAGENRKQTAGENLRRKNKGKNKDE